MLAKVTSLLLLGRSSDVVCYWAEYVGKRRTRRASGRASPGERRPSRTAAQGAVRVRARARAIRGLRSRVDCGLGTDGGAPDCLRPAVPSPIGRKGPAHSQLTRCSATRHRRHARSDEHTAQRSHWEGAAPCARRMGTGRDGTGRSWTDACAGD